MQTLHDCSCTTVLHLPSQTIIMYLKSQLKQYDNVRKHFFPILTRVPPHPHRQKVVSVAPGAAPRLLDSK